MTRLKTIGLLYALLLLAAATAACSGGKPANAKADQKSEAEAITIEVATVPVLERSTRRGIEVVGSLEAQDEVTVSSQSSGNLEEIGVDVGTPVSRGQAIGRIDSRELRLRVEQSEAALRQAEARLGIGPGEKLDPQKQPDVRQAKAALERARFDLNASQRLVEQGDISRQQLDVAQRAFEQAEARYQAAFENVRNLEAVLAEKRASLELSRKQLNDSAIISPLSGIVKEKLASRGEYLQPGKAVATIVQINPLRLKLEVPEAFSASISRGQTVTLKVDAFADREFQGQIKRINPSVDEKNRSLIAEAEVPNGSGLLRPGMFARAQVVSKTEGMAMMVPERAVVSLAGVNKVFVVEGARAVERQVKIGTRDGSLVEILEGVRVGERVVTTNTDKLHDGVTVSAAAS
jgi:RND family efflux transporter MFP subunit